MNSEKVAMRVSRNSIIINVFLALFKIVAGVIGKSQAMISDAIHSLSDVFSTFIVMIGVKIGNKKADDSHPYGHERFEAISALVLAFILGYTGLTIGINSIKAIVSGSNDFVVPGVIALVAALVSILVKEIMYWYTIYYAKKIKSTALKADAWHHRSDALSSVGSLLGIAATYLGFSYGDVIASLLISFCIIKVAYDIFIDATNKIVDKACDEETLNEYKKTICDNDQVLNIDSIKSRIFGNRIYLDIEIAVLNTLSLEEAHRIAEDVHDSLENKYACIKHCMIHVNPLNKSN